MPRDARRDHPTQGEFDLIDSSRKTANDGRTDYEVMIDFEGFVQRTLDGLSGMLAVVDRPPVDWLPGNGRVASARLDRTFVEKAFSCLTHAERRAVLNEFRSDESMDIDATCVVYRHYLMYPTSENHNPSSPFMCEIAEDIAHCDRREPSPLGDLLLSYFYTTDPACRSEANAEFKRASKGCDLAEIRAAQAKSSAETIERINAFSAMDEQDLFPCESEKEGALEGER
jgi:hypothetical protein